MIQGDDIRRLVDLLTERSVFLYHARQLLDFRSYQDQEVRGIPSRALLKARELPFTPFETDEDDLNKDVWNKVFLNFEDFGTIFADGKKGVPTPYGPISLKIGPEILNEAKDIDVSLVPVGSNYYSERISLKIDDIDGIFKYPSYYGPPQSTEVKCKDKLQEDFACPTKPSGPDLSCTVIGGKLPFKRYVKKICVDPYTINGKPLRDWAAEAAPPHLDSFFQERLSVRKPLYNELARLISNGVSDIRVLLQSSRVSKELSDWAREIEGQNLGYQFRRYANYLRYGTLQETLDDDEPF